MNRLPAVYPSWLPIDTNFHGVPDQSVRTVAHLHGATSLPRFDGHPENWFRTGESDQYFYGNLTFSQSSQTLWYHDHTIGVTGNNVYAGLAGFYLLRNPAQESLAPASSGIYVYHCHILDHEDNDMMRPFQLLPPYQPRLETLYDPAVNPSGLNHFRIGIATRLNETYRLESTADLSAPAWSELPQGPIAGTGGAL